MQQWVAVQELRKKNVPIAQIARQLGMARNTVKRLLKEKEEPKYTRLHYPSKIDPYKEQIFEWYTSSHYDYNGTRILRELKKLGYTGELGPIYRFLSKIDASDSAISKLATVRIETPCGDQAQFDWSPYEVWVGTRKRTIYCFTMILSASRKKAICFSLKADSDAIYEAIQELFWDLGGVTLELMIDNPKSLVIENNPKNEDEVCFNPQALLIAAHLNTQLNACNCYWPRTKGKIENPYKYIEQQFIKGNKFKSMEDLTTRGKAFIDEWNDQIHGTTKRIPNEFFQNEEIHALLPLPGFILRLTTVSKRKVSNDSFIHINTNKYSVPVQYATKFLYFRIIYGFRIQILSENNDVILTIEQMDGKQNTLVQSEHYEAIKPRASKSIPQITRDFTATFMHGKEYLEIASLLFQQPTYHARKILELTDLYDVEDLDKVIAFAIKESRLDITSFKNLLKECYFEIITAQMNKVASHTKIIQGDTGLTRDCNYYDTLEVIKT